MALRDHLIPVRLGQNGATEKEDHSLWLNRHNFICQALKWETHCWWDQKRKSSSVIFLLFPAQSLSFSFPCYPPPSLPAGSLETKGKGSRKVGVPRGTHTSLNIQNIAYEVSEELSILLWRNKEFHLLVRDVKGAFQSRTLTLQNTFLHRSSVTAHPTQHPGRKGSHIHSCQTTSGREQGMCRQVEVHTVAVVLHTATAAQGKGQLSDCRKPHTLLHLACNIWWCSSKYVTTLARPSADTNHYSICATNWA